MHSTANPWMIFALVGLLSTACVPGGGGGGGGGGSGGAPTDAGPDGTVDPDDGIPGDRGVDPDDGIPGDRGVDPDDGIPGDRGVDPDDGIPGDRGVDPDDGIPVDRGVDPDDGIPGDRGVDPDRGPPPPLDDLGQECTVLPGCEAGAPDWPACIDDACPINRQCVLPNLASDYGYCTRPCTRDADCAGAIDGPYGDDFVCLTDGVEGACIPGSGAACALADEAPCDGDEVCRWGRGYTAGVDYGNTCQTPTPFGRITGAACDESEGIRCESDICLFGVCTALCDAAVPEPAGLCPRDWSCFDDFDIGVVFDLCLPAYCESNRDCNLGSTCVLAFEFNSDTVLRGLCLPTEESEAQPGEACTDLRPCQGATCLDDGGEGYCAGLCDDDADCAPGGYCDIVNFTVDDAGNSAPAQICRPGALSGSGRDCAVDADCAPAGGIPQEACEYVVRAELEAGRYVEPPALVGRCAAIPAGAVDPGDACDRQPCRTESLCLTSGADAFCSAACRDSADCDSALCFAIDFGGDLFGGVCIPPALFDLDGSSVAACARDADCVGVGESCQLNLVGSTPPVAETVCLTNGGPGPAGSACDAPEDCASLDCQPGPGGAGYCRTACVDDIDCGDDFACVETVVAEGADPLMLCQPAM